MGSQQTKGRKGNKGYNNRIKQNLKYKGQKTTNQRWENLKHAITTAVKDTLGKLKKQPRKPWIIEKIHNPNRTKQETQT